MVLNGISYDGKSVNVVDAAFKGFSNSVDTNKLYSLYKDYMAACNACMGNQACLATAERAKTVGLVQCVKTMFYTKNNFYFPKESKHLITGKCKGIMIHSPDAFKRAPSVIEDFNQNKEDRVFSTHFVIDGDTGYAYCISPLNYRSVHCGCGKEGSFYRADKEPMIAIDICEPSELTKDKANSHADARKKDNFVLEYKETEYVGFSDHCKEGDVWTDVAKSAARASMSKHFEAANGAAVELTAMLCVLLKLVPDAVGDGVGYKGNQLQSPNVVIGHKEGYVNFQKASNHGDPVFIWKAASDLLYKGLDKVTERRSNKFEGMNYFRAEVRKKYDLYKDNETLIHPVLKFLLQTPGK